MKRDLEGLFHAAFAPLSDAAFAVDRQGYLVAGNAAFVALFGISLSTYDNIQIDQLYYGEDEIPEVCGLTISSPKKTPRYRQFRRDDWVPFSGEKSQMRPSIAKVGYIWGRSRSFAMSPIVSLWMKA